MKTKIIRIGNSKGIRIPKSLLEHLGTSQEVILELKDENIVIRPVRELRQGWEAQFKEMSRAGDDRLLDSELSNTAWDDEEWEWK